MIEALVLGAALVMAGVAAARMVARRREIELEDEEDEAERKATPSARGLRVGDVLLWGTDELWLAGMIELREEGLVARLFPTPGGDCEWLAHLDDEGKELLALGPTENVPDGVVPESLPFDGRRLKLVRRGHADVRREGEHLPRVTQEADYVLMADSGGRHLVVVDFRDAKGGLASRLALLGDRIPPHQVELLPGGDLES